MAEPQNCPSRDELQRLVLGQLPGQVADRIQQHLEECPKCWSAFDECVNSEELLNAVRAQRSTTSEPTKTLYLPIECLRSALATWSYDKTQSDKGEAPFSESEISRHLAPAQAADEIGRLGDFRVLRVLGSGGFAVVFEAEDIRLKRHVALKVMHPLNAARHADRFLREAQSAAALRHEHVVTIYQVGMHGDTPFIALELLHGETLEDHLIRESRLSVQETVRIGREIASGLAAAHARGLLHRDIKPANIWLEGPEKPVRQSIAPQDKQLSTSAARAVEPGPSPVDGGRMGKVKILDFGCAKSWADDSAISDRGMLIGTPAYMAPEQLAGEAVDPRADLFSLGCLLYRMGAGKRPFSGNNLFSVVRALALEDPAPLETVNPQVPQALSELVSKLLAKCPDERPASAQIVVDRLRAIEADLSRQQVVEQVPQIAEKSRPAAPSTAEGPPKRGRKWAIGAGLGLAVLLAVVYFLFGAQLIRVATNQGQVIIAVDDPSVTVTVKDGLIVVHDGQGRAEIALGAGDHQLEVTLKQPTGDATFKTDKFTLSRGGRKIFEAREELAKVAASPTPALPTPIPPPIVATPSESRMRGTIAKEQKPPAPAVADSDRRAAQWVLSQGGTVTGRAGQPPQEVQLGPGQALPPSNLELTKVALESDQLTDAGLDHLRGLHH
ncbi:MAG TPA: protein kinase, partial [Planctomycetaceae bacterium]|nr:protein kinase [Planctomycetaceae bacterium]